MPYQSKRLHLGCGLNTPEGWINLDGSLNAWLAKHAFLRKTLKLFGVFPNSQFDIPWSPDILVHDARKSLPFRDNSLEAIYASHFLEHLYLKEARRLLKECFRVLQPNGILRMVVPDLRSIVREYIDSQSVSGENVPLPADVLMQKLLLRGSEPPGANTISRVYTSISDFHSHKWMYDADSLIEYFTSVGFVEVTERSFRDSRIEQIATIEESGRVLNGAGICVEGIKPLGNISP